MTDRGLVWLHNCDHFEHFVFENWLDHLPLRHSDINRNPLLQAHRRPPRQRGRGLTDTESPASPHRSAATLDSSFLDGRRFPVAVELDPDRPAIIISGRGRRSVLASQPVCYRIRVSYAFRSMPLCHYASYA